MEAVRYGPAQDPDGVKTELVQKLVSLKKRSRKGIRHWRGYVWVSLRNHALNVARHRKNVSTIPVDAVESQDEERNFESGVILAAGEAPLNKRAVLSLALEDLIPEHRELCHLLKKGITPADAGRMLGKHRNTIRLWMRRIAEVFKRHGLDADFL